MNTLKERMDEVLNKPMDRQQFLRQVGLLMLAVVGITTLINNLEGSKGGKTGGNSNGSAYGSSVYAGGRKPL